MKKTKAIFLILFLFFIILIISGCSNYNEINNVMLVDGIGIDKINNKYVVSFNTYLQNDKYEVIDVEVETLDKAFNEIYLTVNKKVYLSHLNILFLSSNLSNDDINDIFNTFNNRNDLRGTFLITMVYDYNQNIFNNESLYIVNLLNNNYMESGDIYPTTFNEMLSEYLNLSISYIPIINNNDLKIIGMHSLFSEYRFYNLNESKYLNLLSNKLSSSVFVLDDEEVRIDNIDVCYEVKENNITFKLYLSHSSNLNNNEIESFLTENINSFFELDINNYYFLNLIKKKAYAYFNNHDSFSISYNIEIFLNKEYITNIKEDDLLEKDK